MFSGFFRRLELVRDRVYERPYMVLSSIGLVALLVFLVAIPLPRVDGQLVGGDGISYYMYVRSFWIDGDLDFRDEYQYFKGYEGPIIPATGLAHNQYGIGCGLMWSPFFLVAHGVANLLNLVGINTPVDGYSYLYQAITLLGSLFYGWLGLLVSFRLASRLYPRSSALLATVLIWLASFVLYYMIAESSMSHANSMFAVALFVYYWYSTGADRSSMQWAALGLLGALIPMIRNSDAIFLIIPAVEFLHVLVRAITERDLGRLWKYMARIGVFLVALFVGFLPQLAAWKAMYGEFLGGGMLYGRDLGPAYFQWLSPHIAQVLFSGWHGLFSWHPILLFAVLGLFFLRRRDRLLGASTTAAFLAILYLVSAWSQWWQAAAFGGRMFMSCGIIFVLGLTAFIDWLRERQDSLWIELAALAFVIWNGLFMIQYRFGFVSLFDPLTFREIVIDKFTLPFQLLRRLFR